MKLVSLLVPLFSFYSAPYLMAQTKVAFVAGVERYDKSGLTNLEYAEDDARQVQAQLNKLGFSVFPVIGDEANLAKLNSAMDRFITTTKNSTSPTS